MQLPILRPDQYRIAIHPAKVKVLSMGRRWGKTILGGAIVGTTLSKHGRVAWVTPTYKNSRPLWRWLLNAAAKDIKTKKLIVNRADRTIETRGGGFLALYSGDNIDAIRGEAFDLVVMDEAARLFEYAWSDVIMPTLADYDGDAILISTPAGKNWFWHEYLREFDDDDYKSWQAPTKDNPHPAIQRAAELARTRVPESKYQQEWLAEFLDSGSIFRNVREAATARPQRWSMDELDTQGPRHEYIIGVDWGKYEDYSVFAVIDATTSELCRLDRSNHIEYQLQLERLKQLVSSFSARQVIAESNSIGDPLAEQLRRAGVPLQEFTTTNRSKQELIEALMLALEQGKIKILNDPVLIAELQAFEATRLPGGGLRYAAPEGYHDDCVMALALAWSDAGRRVDRKPLQVQRARTVR